MEIIKNGFKNERLGIELDVYVIEGKEWFRAKDISEFLRYQDTNKMMRSIEITEFNCIRQTLSGVNNNRYEADFINESALYEIVFSITKRDIERYNKAREFQKWVFEEVLPSLRKNHYYVDKENITQDQLEELKTQYFYLCHESKIPLGKASERIFGNKRELKRRLIELGWLDYDNCTVKQITFHNSRDEEYELFVWNVSGTYTRGKAKEQLQVSVSGAGILWLENYFKNRGDYFLLFLFFA